MIDFVLGLLQVGRFLLILDQKVDPPVQDMREDNGDSVRKEVDVIVLDFMIQSIIIGEYKM